jgi:hypothetical protein
VFYIVDEKQYADEFSLPLHTGRCSTAAAILLLPLFDCCQFELARRSTPAAVCLRRLLCQRLHGVFVLRYSLLSVFCLLLLI